MKYKSRAEFAAAEIIDIQKDDTSHDTRKGLRKRLQKKNGKAIIKENESEMAIAQSERV